VLVEERRHRVLELVKNAGFVDLTELARVMDCSKSTVRRDLDFWDEQGLLKRTHGGAMFTGEQGELPALEERLAQAVTEKALIAQTAAGRISDGSVILLDGGTTTLEVARSLLGRSVQVVTNSLPIAALLSGSKETELIILGGYVYPKTGVALGPLTIAMLEKIQVQQAILSVSGITQRGLFNSNLLLVETERAMMRCADEVVVVADHFKLDRSALALLCPLSAVDTLIVDPGIKPEQRRWIEEAGVRLLVAGEAKASEEFRA
jgi:DeoR family transcriptional regulator, fructose operon transcriptional repressor